jgi:hypothetical protein
MNFVEKTKNVLTKYPRRCAVSGLFLVAALGTWWNTPDQQSNGINMKCGWFRFGERTWKNEAAPEDSLVTDCNSKVVNKSGSYYLARNFDYSDNILIPPKSVGYLTPYRFLSFFGFQSKWFNGQNDYMWPPHEKLVRLERFIPNTPIELNLQCYNKYFEEVGVYKDTEAFGYRFRAECNVDKTQDDVNIVSVKKSHASGSAIEINLDILETYCSGNDQCGQRSNNNRHKFSGDYETRYIGKTIQYIHIAVVPTMTTSALSIDQN